ncbi:hypothetical protein MASR2M12_23670 [Bacteroidales bacterium]
MKDNLSLIRKKIRKNNLSFFDSFSEVYAQPKAPTKTHSEAFASADTADEASPDTFDGFGATYQTRD